MATVWIESDKQDPVVALAIKRDIGSEAMLEIKSEKPDLVMAMDREGQR